MNLKTLLVTKPIECPLCSHGLSIGDTMYTDEDRNETLCCYCKEDYQEEITIEEGENGELLK